MMRSFFTSIFLLVVFTSNVSSATAGIPNLDSSNWSTDPRAFGMSPREYIQAESRAFFADFISRAGVNTFYNFPGVATAADRFVVSPNNDTIYSIAVVNVRDGSFQVAFGGEACRRLAPNCVYTPKDGWSLLLRNDRPDVELFRHYQMPELIEVN